MDLTGYNLDDPDFWGNAAWTAASLAVGGRSPGGVTAWRSPFDHFEGKVESGFVVKNRE